MHRNRKEMRITLQGREIYTKLGKELGTAPPLHQALPNFNSNWISKGILKRFLQVFLHKFEGILNNNAVNIPLENYKKNF